MEQLAKLNTPNLTIWSIAGSSDHLMQIIPINNLTIGYAPNANLSIKGSANEVSIINRIKLDASYCIKENPKDKNVFN